MTVPQRKNVPNCDYQRGDTTKTLQEGLNEYYAANPGFDSTGEFLGQARETVLAHDVAHVVFGLNSSSEDELIVETMTLFGCILPIKKVIEMPKTKFAVELVKTFGPWRMIRRFVLTSPRIARAFVRAMQQKKKWPHFDYKQYLNIPLQDIRREFGIKTWM